MTKRCSSCRLDKPLEAFPSRKRGSPDGLSYLCRDCHNKKSAEWARLKWANDPEYREKRKRYAAEWRARHPQGELERQERARGYKRHYKHGVTVEDYDRMSEAQGHVCAICRGLPSRTKYLHVDHDHKSGVIRGLLCEACNLGLGKFKDDPGLLEAATGYLRSASP